MLIRSLPLLLAASNTAYALKDALPFLMLSTESIDSAALASKQIDSAESLQPSLQKALGSCSASQYIFVEQPGVRPSDLSDSDSMPLLAKRLGDEQYKSIVQVPEVMGKMSLVQSQIFLEERCGREKVTNVMLSMIGDEKEGKARREMVREADVTLEKTLHSIRSNHTSHVLIFNSVPADEDAQELEHLRYDLEMDEPPFQAHMHTDLKRDIPQQQRRQASSGDDFQDGLPLFEKYQFLSPAIFMGLSVSLLLLIILYVGISAIAGLEVSYMAFSKEMGPQAQKKQQ